MEQNRLSFIILMPETMKVNKNVMHMENREYQRESRRRKYQDESRRRKYQRESRRRKYQEGAEEENTKTRAEEENIKREPRSKLYGPVEEGRTSLSEKC